MSDKPAEEDTIIYHEAVKEQMAADPKLAEWMRNVAASMRQAQHDVKTGKYANFEDAMEAITGKRPRIVNTDEE